ncbi:MAG: peptidoglycan bridge formation glycyltransferase FemA/FemB family protein [Desulfobacterales bacterium]
MIQIKLKPIHTRDINPGPVLQQSAYWANVKKRQGWRIAAFKTRIESCNIHQIDGGFNDFQSTICPLENCTRADILVMIGRIGNKAHMAYIPYGPLFEPNEENRGRCLEKLSENLRPFLPKDCIFIRYDLIWNSPYANDKNFFDSNGQWLGPPEPRIRELRMNFNTNNWNLHKAVTDILPSNTVLLNLSKSQNHLLKKMKPKTRYNIRLSLRKGVRVRNAGMEELPVWYDLYRQTACRNGICLHNIDHFKASLEARAINPETRIHMLLAEIGNKPLAGMFLAISGERATYLYGASSSANRKLMGTYALQWEAINIARQAGCREYDFFGISPTPNPSHPMYGLYRFKSGFGGKILHRQGCWDYALDSKRYEGYRAQELAAEGYHLS